MNTEQPSIQLCITPSLTIKENIPFGNIMQLKNKSSFRIYYQNVNGIYKGNSWADWKAMANQAQILQIDVIGFTETNKKEKPKLQQSASSLALKYIKNCQMATSAHNGFSFANYQPGGTSTSICSNAIGRIVTKINDTSPMGQWSGFKLHTNNGTHINIKTVYQSTNAMESTRTLFNKSTILRTITVNVRTQGNNYYLICRN
jgi:hypothetical protein